MDPASTMKQAGLFAVLLTSAILASAQAPSASVSASPLAACKPDPLSGRALYLRGSFNSWTAANTQQFKYSCNRFELVTTLAGAHTFKVGDEEWSSDADFGADPNTPAAPGKSRRLIARGADIRYTFQGMHRIELDMTSPSEPRLSISNCPSPPLGAATLFLRGTMNNWGAQDAFAFTYSCDAYYLNVKLRGPHEFKIVDAAWRDVNTMGAAGGAPATLKFDQALSIFQAGRTGSEDGGGNVANLGFGFDGEQTLRLAFPGGRPTLTIGAKSFADPNEPAVTDPLALSLRFDSRDLAHKSPFGAVPVGTKVGFTLTAQPGIKHVTLVLEKRRMEGNQDVLEYTLASRLPMTMSRAPAADHEHWSAEYTFADASVYGYYFEIVIGDKTFIYQNNTQSIHWTREKGSNGLGMVGVAGSTTKTIRRFRHTVFARDLTVPAWARDVVYYYIFPDRFRNGDANNDHRPGIDTYQDKGVEFHRNWLDKPSKPGTGDGSDAVYNNDFFGGDIAGIIEKLDYIADLGANTIYMTPVFRASSNHKYDTADFKNIDPHFGTNADFETLTMEAKKRGIRVIPDTSLNHVGSDSIYFDRFGKYQSKGAFRGGKVRRDSPYASWFTFDETKPDPDKQFKGWVGVTDLPELNKASPAYRAFAYGATDSVTKVWLDRGAAGWRMDVAPWVPDDFWREWRAAVKQHRPDALTISETWFDASKYFLGDMFDTTMNYIFRNSVLDYAGGGKAKQMYANLELIREVYPAQTFYALMNLLSTHDAARALHVFGFEGERTEAEKIRLAKQQLRLAVFFQMIYPGAPTIYYGDEVGVTGGEDPYNRATYPWADKGGKPDLALHADFKTLIKMRNDHPVLRHGTLDAPVYIDDNVIVLVRRLGSAIAVTATNNADSARTVNVKLPADLDALEFREALTGARVEAKNRAITIDVPALFGRVLISR